MNNNELNIEWANYFMSTRVILLVFNTNVSSHRLFRSIPSDYFVQFEWFFAYSPINSIGPHIQREHGLFVWDGLAKSAISVIRAIYPANAPCYAQNGWMKTVDCTRIVFRWCPPRSVSPPVNQSPWFKGYSRLFLGISPINPNKKNRAVFFFHTSNIFLLI